MPWTLTSFLAHRKARTPATAPTAFLNWPPEETERLASGSERAQLSDNPDRDRRA